ncbi:MAG: hypothetical protein V4534_05390 [Myxococcota bacterium]
MDVQKASEVLRKSIKTPKNPMTIADAASDTGLSFAEVDRGLMSLVSEFRGELIPTEKGELLFRFPFGFSKPWERKEAFDVAWSRIKRSVLGVAKFVVRAWITIVMVAYVAIFAAILIALAFAQKSDRDDRGSSFGNSLMLHSLLRVISDSLFWTFHPFSPYRIQKAQRGYGQRGPAFYEKVNRFFFGPQEIPTDPLEAKKLVLEEIRAQKGRIGMLDVLKVTGMTREQADPFLASLMLEYNGDVHVSDFGGITYSFPELRKTTSDAFRSNAKAPSWLRSKTLAPLTGNETSSNVLIAGLNGFNLFMSLVAIENNWTLEHLRYLLSGIPPHLIPDTGAPLILGWIPFWFSVVLFALPVMRLFTRPAKQKELDRDNGRRGMLWAILSNLTPRGISERILKSGWQGLAQKEPSSQELTREVVKLGGDLDLDTQTAEMTYRFKSLELEVSALEKERARAGAFERDVGAQIQF